MVLLTLLLVGLWSTTLWVGPADDDLVSGMSLVQGELQDKQDDSFTFQFNADGVAVVHVPSSGFRADQKPILRLNSSLTDPTLETIFLWQTFDGVSGQEVLIQPLSGSAVHDLSDNPNWRGLIRSMAIQFSVVPDIGFKTKIENPVRIHHFSLAQGHWLDPISTTISAWLNMDSVTMRTPSHVGFADNGSISPALVLGMMVLAVSLLCWWFLSLQTIVLVFILSCFMLSLVELSSEMKSASHYAKASEDYRAGLHNETDKALRELADEVKAVLQNSQQDELVKVMVSSASDYNTKRLIYHLLPYNAGEMILESLSEDFQPQPPLYMLRARRAEDSCEVFMAELPYAENYRLLLERHDHCLMEVR